MLQNAPDMPTIILLKNKVQMGTDINCKQYVGFTFDTMAKCNHDTLTQGLLGRMCGYTPIPDDLEIYVQDPKKAEDIKNECLEQLLGIHMKPVAQRNVDVQDVPDGDIPIPENTYPTQDEDDPLHIPTTDEFMNVCLQYPKELLAKGKKPTKKELCTHLLKQRPANSHSPYPPSVEKSIKQTLELGKTKPNSLKCMKVSGRGIHVKNPQFRLSNWESQKGFKGFKKTLFHDPKGKVVHLDILDFEAFKKLEAGKTVYYVGLHEGNVCGRIYTKGSSHVERGSPDTTGDEMYKPDNPVPEVKEPTAPEGGISGVTPDLLEQITKSPEFLKQHLKQQIAFKPDGTCYLKTHSLRAPKGDLVLSERPYLQEQTRWNKKCLEKWLPPQLELVDFTTPEKHKGYSQGGRAQKTAGWKLPTISEGEGPLRIIRGGLQWKLKDA